MANTYVDYTGDGNQTSFAYTFAVLSGRQQDHIIVGVDDSTTTGGKFEVVDPADYTIDASAGTITFDTAPESGARIRIRRDSDASTLLVDFKNGTVLPERDLDLAYVHNLYLNEEIEEGSGRQVLTKNDDGNYDGDSVKLVNLADPENAQDAVTKGYADTRFVNVTGDTMSGALTLPNADPTNDDHAARKKYVDDEVADEATARVAGDALQVSKTGDTMTGALTLPSSDPTNDDHATRKGYVDSQIEAAVLTGTPGGQIDTANIADGAVTAVKIADDDPVFNVQSDGKVGIGTTSPDSQLHIEGDGTETTSLTLKSGDTAQTTSISFVAVSERARITSGYGSGGGGYIQINTDTTQGNDIERMTIGNDGSVFIGELTGFPPVEPPTQSTGGILYVSNGALLYKGSNGTVTTLANS
jgi:hypothetical protein